MLVKKASSMNDTCPLCDGEVVMSCKCLRNERYCCNHHQWRRLPDGTAMLTKGNGHTDWKVATQEMRDNYQRSAVTQIPKKAKKALKKRATRR